MNKTKLILKQNPTLPDFQDYVAQLVKERGFDKETVPEMFMLFLEESGATPNPAIETVAKIAKGLGVPIDKLVNE